MERRFLTVYIIGSTRSTINRTSCTTRVLLAFPGSDRSRFSFYSLVELSVVHYLIDTVPKYAFLPPELKIFSLIQIHFL